MSNRVTVVAMARHRGFLAGCAVVLLAAGCGGSGSAQKVTVEATAAAMRQAADTTLSKGTSHVAVTTVLNINGQDVTLNATGGIDPANRRMSLSFDVREFFTKLLQGATVPPEASAALAEPLTVLLDGTTMYLHFPFVAKLTGGNKEWVKLDLAAGNAGLGDVLGSGSGAFGSDPSSLLEFLKGAGKVSEVGREDVRGVSTRHFSGSYTIKDALASVSDEQRQKLEDAFKGFGLPASAEDTEIPFDVWIGDDGVVRKVSYSFDVSKLEAGSASARVGNITETIEYFDFGQPIDFQLPPDDEVRDFNAAFGSASSEKFSSVGSSIGN